MAGKDERGAMVTLLDEIAEDNIKTGKSFKDCFIDKCRPYGLVLRSEILSLISIDVARTIAYGH
jgi:hypothetical protein